MKAVLFVPSVPESEWIREILPDKSPAELPLAGRRWADFAVEWAMAEGFEMVEILDWHRANLDLLAGTGFGGRRFTLPGYSAEEGVHLGRNVVTERGFEAKPPVLLQDDAWCARNVRLDGDVIVNTGSFIGEGAQLRRTVVCGDTFVGEGLDLDGKIVAGRRIIDADTGAWVDVEDPGLARRIPTGLGWLRSLWHFVRGHSFGRRG